MISRLDGSAANNLMQAQQTSQGLPQVSSSFTNNLPTARTDHTQRSIFSGPPPSIHPLPQPPPKSAPATVPINGLGREDRGKSPGIKRYRDEEAEGVEREDKKVKASEEESGSDAPMEEDDEGEEMDVSDED